MTAEYLLLSFVALGFTTLYLHSKGVVDRWEWLILLVGAGLYINLFYL